MSIQDITKKIETFSKSFSFLYYYCKPEFLQKNFDYNQMSIETYQNISNENIVKFGPETDSYKDYNDFIIKFIEKIFDDHYFEENLMVLEKIKELKPNDKNFYHSFLFMVDIFTIFKENQHPIYCLFYFISIGDWKEEHLIFLKNMTLLFFTIFEIEIKRKKITSYKKKLGFIPPVN